LILFRFADATKDPRRIEELASAVFHPMFAPGGADSSYQRFVVSKFLGSTVPGANFSIGQGLGVAGVAGRVHRHPPEAAAQQPERLGEALPGGRPDVGDAGGGHLHGTLHGDGEGSVGGGGGNNPARQPWGGGPR